MSNISLIQKEYKVHQLWCYLALHAKFLKNIYKQAGAELCQAQDKLSYIPEC